MRLILRFTYTLNANENKKGIHCIIDDKKESFCVCFTIICSPSLRYFHCNELIMHEREASDDEEEEEEGKENDEKLSLKTPNQLCREQIN